VAVCSGIRQYLRPASDPVVVEVLILDAIHIRLDVNRVSDVPGIS
jgi:hypothetical protein